ncbi:alpha/beta hydrolase-fold protein [Planctomicrobium sp. SH668]|uniref:carboxylesterase family protein n=1 Tax=Planctomicrobium sp. SH668 TaxID=3448126 RepID=UPI003F5C9845
MNLYRYFAVCLLASWICLGQLSFAVLAEELNCNSLPVGFQLRDYVDSEGSAHRYAVFTPKQYQPDQKWPVVLFLHGAGEKGTDGKIPLYGMLTAALEKNPELPFIAVFPQCEDVSSRALTGWLAGSRDGERSIQILDEVMKDFSIDPKRQILAGWSMGGYGAWSLGAAHADRWSAVLVLAGGAVDDDLDVQQLARQKTPVWAISGEIDPLVPFQRSERIVEKLKAAAGNGTFTKLPKVGHDVCRNVFASPQTFQWMLDPASIDPAGIDLLSVAPLPSRSRFYSECLVETQVIPNALSIRVGNGTLRQLASDLPELLKETPLRGSLPDIARVVGTGEERMDVLLSNVGYDCQLSQISLEGISGGRLGLRVFMKPFEIVIGNASLKSKKHSIQTDEIRIRIGIHQPAELRLEVQPVMEAGRLRLRLLRKSFHFTDGNWYIVPPEKVDAKSDEFTPDQLVTGILGTLYENRDELVGQVLSAVPDLIRSNEDKIQSIDAPELAKLLSPLPVLVPELAVAPSQVRVDSQGISLLCNLNVSVRGPVQQVPSGYELDLKKHSNLDELAASVSLDAVTTVSQLNINQNFAQVNVLDISDENFANFANPAVMNQIFPEMNASENEHLESILRLLSPMVISKSAAAEANGDLGVELHSPAIAIDVYRRPEPTAEAIPYGRILFTLKQPLTLQLPEDRNAPDAKAKLVWNPESHVQFLKGTTIEGNADIQVDGGLFETTFSTAWAKWGAEFGTSEFPLQLQELGKSELRLESIQISDRELSIQGKAQLIPLPVAVPDEE